MSTELGNFNAAQSPLAVLALNVEVTLALPMEIGSMPGVDHSTNTIRGLVKTCVFRLDGFLVEVDCGLEKNFEFILKEPVDVNSQITLELDASAIKLLRE